MADIAFLRKSAMASRPLCGLWQWTLLSGLWQWTPSGGLCCCLLTASFRCHALTCDVEQDGADDNETQDHVLDCGINAGL